MQVTPASGPAGIWPLVRSITACPVGTGTNPRVQVGIGTTWWSNGSEQSVNADG